MSSEDFPTADEMRGRGSRPMRCEALERLAAEVHDLLERHGAYSRWRSMVCKWQSEHQDPVDLIPLPKRALTLPEKYVLLAAMHDECGKGELIDPWEGMAASSENFEEMKEYIAYAIVRGSVRRDPDRFALGIPECDEPYLRLCLVAVEADLTQAETGPSVRNAIVPKDEPEATEKPNASVKSKRSTVKGEARFKLIAALTKHHKYADGSCLELAPIGNNVLARLADVSESTASAFFNKEFNAGTSGGYVKYRSVCSDATGLVAALKLLNDEFSPHHLFGSKPPEECEREDDD